MSSGSREKAPVVDMELLENTPMGFDNPFNNDTLKEQGKPIPEISFNPKAIHAIEPAVITKAGRVSKPVLRLETSEGGKGQKYPAGTQFLTDTRTGMKYRVSEQEDGSLIGTSLEDPKSIIDIYGDIDHPTKWHVEDTVGHKFNVQRGGKTRRVKYTRLRRTRKNRR